MSATAPHTARLPLPDFIVQGRDHVLSCPIYRDGARVEPASGTVSVYDGAGALVVEDAAIASPIVGSTATYTIPAATTSSLARSMGWRVEWELTLDDGTVLTPKNDAALIRSELLPVITDADLIRRVPSLDPTSPRRIAGPDGFQPFIDEAWVELVQRLMAQGQIPHRIIYPGALRPTHLALALCLIFEDAANRLNAAYQERAEFYREQYRSAFDQLSLVYDTDDDGHPDQRSRPAVSTVWLSGR